MDIFLFVALPLVVLLYSAVRIKQSGSHNLTTGIAALSTSTLFVVSGVSAAGFASRGVALDVWKQHSKGVSMAATSFVLALVSLIFCLTCAVTSVACIVRRKSGWRAAFALQAVMFLVEFLFFLQLAMEA